jgi:nucleotide-binding universal stress UspA family protein
MIKDIVVQLTGSEEDSIRLGYAGPIARMFDAHLTGLQVNERPDILSLTDPSGSAFLQASLEESDKHAEKVTAALEPQLAALGLRTELRRIDCYPGVVGNDLAEEARTADLFIGTRPYGDPTGQQHIEETVLFNSGRGCLFVPPKKAAPNAYETIYVAWKNTRESARAVAESLPFLQQAKQVIVGIIEEQAGEQYKVEAGADIGRHLSRHGVSAEIRKISGWVDAGEAILNEAERSLADMLVMGGYGHSRFREWVLGGATRYLLTNAAIPVLMAH